MGACKVHLHLQMYKLLDKPSSFILPTKGNLAIVTLLRTTAAETATTMSPKHHVTKSLIWLLFSWTMMGEHHVT